MGRPRLRYAQPVRDDNTVPPMLVEYHHQLSSHVREIVRLVVFFRKLDRRALDGVSLSLSSV